MSDWIEVKSEIFAFDKVGVTLQGRYVTHEKGTRFDNEVYQIETKEGMKAVFSTTVLASLMKRVPVGALVRIKFSGLEEAKVKGRNDTKLFEVAYKF